MHERSLLFIQCSVSFCRSWITELLEEWMSRRATLKLLRLRLIDLMWHSRTCILGWPRYSLANHTIITSPRSTFPELHVTLSPNPILLHSPDGVNQMCGGLSQYTRLTPYPPIDEQSVESLRELPSGSPSSMFYQLEY